VKTPDAHAEDGFGLIELIVAMVVLQVALLAILGAFGAGSVALGHASRVSTAATMADQQMELYRAMPYDAIGLDTGTAPTTGTYVSDTSVCPTGLSPTCGNTVPINNAGNDTWSCTATSGATSVAVYFTANGANPCTAHRQVTSAASPDGRPYYVDTYITPGSISGLRGTKVVSVVVRQASTATELAKEVTTFDCSTGNAYNTAPC
jgi:type II secretory pathway pseudopilin PulG